MMADMEFDPRKHDPRPTAEIRQMYLDAKAAFSHDPLRVELADAGLAFLDAELAAWKAKTPQERRDTQQRLRDAKFRAKMAADAIKRRDIQRPQ